ncbi:hypothetical protein SDC9_75005 [bioreactor metagenome]|uniref:Uncharacterized protein n=1 Tax=bioreactor metagenome TaxID=1076179 RepID=A0A644YJF8_9ZZZZ
MGRRYHLSSDTEDHRNTYQTKIAGCDCCDYRQDNRSMALGKTRQNTDDK